MMVAHTHFSPVICLYRDAEIHPATTASGRAQLSLGDAKSLRVSAPLPARAKRAADAARRVHDVIT